MCGIAGFSLSPDEHPDVIAVAKAMLLAIESRGRDATGIAFTDDNGMVWTQKTNVSASRFVKDIDDDAATARRVILHTRYATQGSPKNNNNNHPIQRPGIVGVHNGCLYNDDALFKTLGSKRYGIVDSEAIFALIGEGRDVFTGSRTHDLLSLVEGSAAIAWLNVGHKHTLNVARISSSPLIIGRTVKGSFLFASTEGAIKAACTAGKMELEFMTASIEGAHYRIHDGQIVAMRLFEPSPPIAKHPRRYTTPLPNAARGYSYGQGWTDARTARDDIIGFEADDDTIDLDAYDRWRYEETV